MRVTNIVVICGSLGLLVHCDFLKKKGSDQADGAAQQANNGQAAGTTTTNAASDNNQNTLQNANDPSKGSVTGCGWPTDGSKNATITEGCTVTVKSTLNLNEGATLTIEKGAKIAFDTDQGIQIEYGKVVIAGTADKPVIFTSANTSPAPGDWWGIRFHEKTAAGTTIDHAIFEYTGSNSGGSEAALHVDDMRQGGRITVTNTTFRNNAKFGVFAGDNAMFGKFENNTFKDNKLGSVKAKPEVLGSFGHGNTFTQPLHTMEGTVDQTTTWPAFDAPVVVDGTIRVESDNSVPILTIADKTIVKMGQDTGIRIGERPGALVAKNVTFTSGSPSPTPGDWGGFFVYPKASGTDVEGCTFEYFGADAGGGKGAITLWGQSQKDLRGITLTNNTFRLGKKGAMNSDDGHCGDFPAKNKLVGVDGCTKP